MGSVPCILVHGGAGRWRRVPKERLLECRRVLREAIEVGFEVLKSGSALDAVVEAVARLEDSGLFNAGRGSALNLRREVEMDAGVMWGRDLSVGAVAAVRNVRNPIKLARAVMERTDHVLVVGAGAEWLAKVFGQYQEHVIDGDRLQRFERYLREWVEGRGFTWLRRNVELAKLLGIVQDTVGAVALDRSGNVAAAVSTGGYWLKLPGRVGDSAVPGAGFYADNSCAAASATGVGEYIMRFCLCYRVCDLVRRGYHPQDAATVVIEELTKLFGDNTAGVIVVDVRGRIGVAFNTEGMLHGFLSPELKEPLIGVFRDEVVSHRLKRG
ncbi:MAG: asparaginase [Thermoprotei archaeon]|nr:MAG: asparaginase [Thermoprotei archaeon]